ncbi:MFS transporter [Nocardia sp. BMG111209]|uniref:MFS transporter n=1 Tax=Nocardia sp. BMG111209 TaxID=1160137 RepID=UPI00036C9DE3|nr:MFS transporter [Nocardia sp. BMG111209]
MAISPNIVLLAVSWMVAQLGWSAAANSLLLSQADRLPEHQRGKVAGLSGVVQMVAAVAGTAIASGFIGNTLLVFVVPGLIGGLGMFCWTVFNHEDDARALDRSEALTAARMLSGLVFDPRHHPDFAWNWLGRLLFNFGVTFATTFTTLFFASRLTDDGQVAGIGGFVAVLSIVGVVATAGGALAGGLLSDRLRRRRVFVLLSGVMFTVGAIIMAEGGSEVAVLVVGSSLTSVGLGVFAAVDQAIVLDVLPERGSDAGRFVGINGYSTSIAQGVAPVLAAPILQIGAAGAGKNYSLLFLIAAVCTLAGGLIVVSRVRAAT